MRHEIGRVITVTLEMTEEEFDLHRAALWVAECSYTDEDLKQVVNRESKEEFLKQRMLLDAISRELQ